jgi:hypothetical protein
MRRLNEQGMLRANADPTYGRRLLDLAEAGFAPTRRGRRRIVARFGFGESFRQWARRQGYDDIAERIESGGFR